MLTALMAAIGLILPVPVYFGALPPIGSNMLTPSGLMLPPAATPMPPWMMPREVGDDVAEHVRGDDHVVELGVLHDPHAAGVDVVVVGFDVGVLGRDFFERAPPEVVAEDDVRLGDERELLALWVVALAGELERIANAALAAAAGVEGRLRGDFVGRAFVHEALDAAVEVFGVLADDDEVDVGGAFVAQRRFDAGEQLHGAKVDVLVEAEAEVEQQLAFEDAGGDVGVADGAEEDRVELAELVEVVGREGFARFEIAVAAPVEIGEFELDVLELGDGFQNFDAFGSDFWAGAVSADDGDFAGCRHDGRSSQQMRLLFFTRHKGHEGRTRCKFFEQEETEGTEKFDRLPLFSLLAPVVYLLSFFVFFVPLWFQFGL